MALPTAEETSLLFTPGHTHGANRPCDPCRGALSGCIDHLYIAGVTMREPTFLTLAALAGPPLHGYGVMRQVAALSEGRVRLSAGTLYAALDRLTAEGLIAIDREETVDGRVRRYYRLTEQGGAALWQETARLRSNAEVAVKRLAEWTPRPGLLPS
jgi:DNA-binding PadR family transcriptional regulator